MPPRERDRKWHEKKQGGQNGLAKRAKRYPLTEVEWVTSVTRTAQIQIIQPVSCVQ
jgi:hypothetical protein